MSFFANLNARNIRDLHISPSTMIDISNNQLASLEGLPSPAIIKNLQVSNNKIEKIEEEHLQKCKSLSILDLSSNQISKIENLFYLHHLVSLNLSNNQISVIENLEGDVNLKHLILANNKISTIFIRSPLPKLVLLDVGGNKLRGLTGIKSFPSLSTIHVENNMLKSLNGLQQLLNLRRISAASNQISNFQPFPLPLLSHVELQNNQITSLSSFSFFQSLVLLDLSGNPIDDSGLGINVQFPELKEFRANGSNISDPSFISTIAPSVVIVSLLFCKIASIKNVQLLTNSASNLTYLDIRGNPINSQCYPDISGKKYGDSLPEYDSEELYDAQYSKSSNVRIKYRESVLYEAKSDLVYLDGIKIPGRGEKSILPPSKVNFQFEEKIEKINDESSDLLDISKNQQSVQCDISDESCFFIDRGMQTDPKKMPPNFQYPPTRKIFGTDSGSDSNNNIIENNNVNYGGNQQIPKNMNNRMLSEYEYDDDDDEYNEQESSDDFQSPLKNPMANFESASTSISSDSAPFDVNLMKMGINPALSFTDMDDDDFINCSAATDLDSELFYPHESPQIYDNKRNRCGVHQQRSENCNPEMQKKRGGCAFWVDLGQNTDQEEDERKPRRTNPHPINHKPSVPRNNTKANRKPNNLNFVSNRNLGAHYPFNTKSARKLPWDNEPEAPPKPAWGEKKRRNVIRKTNKR
ncbi:hypothetical protein TRFO_36579 [Tritrichomonas foetus]|uniref:Leucine Rich Repeat family protein n=1 Tax=Tritrichomonas foetus TaxID=1144522 RepID=A0A1J4JJ27_9EUKA|nr:hypothetical protein TRFO_36579 [Tritrichomonas foetus]|eukprot:OHS97228.1 hypothetical protein TRFO_36579 [Tritrichomonas foetus]